MRIAVYTIAKNEAHHVRPYLESCREADVVSIADTGSSDGTPELLRKEGALVHAIAVKPWRFDAARMTALNLVPGDVDVCISMDLDERLAPGWRQELERAWTPGSTRMCYWYTWNWKAPGVPDVVYRGDRIHARGGYVWRHPTHEALYSAGPEQIVESELSMLQFPDVKPRPDDLSLLELAVREDRCPRTLFYLGREHAQRGRWTIAISVLEEYLARPDARWTAQRSHAMRLLGLCHKNAGDTVAALAWLLRSCAEDMGLRENWVELAQLCFETQDWSGGYHACEKALAVRQRPANYESWGYAWGDRPHDLAAVCAWNLGLKERAAEHLREALALNPNEPRLQENARWMLG